MYRPSCNVAVVGCGLGGLAAAIGIKRAGHSVTVFEQAKALSEIGAGIQIPSNSTRILKNWNLLAAVEACSVKPSNIVLRSYRGDILSQQNLVPHVDATYGSPYLVVHRADFLRVLVAEARRLGVDIRLGSSLAKIHSAGPSLQFSSGDIFKSDVVLGADGLWSRCRDEVLGYPSPPLVTGDVAYRVTVDLKSIKADSPLWNVVRNCSVHCWMGPNAHIVTYTMKNGNALNVVLVCSEGDTSASADVERVDMQEVKARFRDFDSHLTALFDSAPFALKWRLRDLPELKTWRHPNANVALLGDACHAMLPYLAQGAAMAIEDGHCLQLLFQSIPSASPFHISQLLRTYEALRKPRTSQMVAGSRQMRQIFHMPNDRAQLRDRIMLGKQTPSEGHPNKWADPVFQKWLLGYDCEKEVRKALRGISWVESVDHAPAARVEVGKGDTVTAGLGL